MPGQQAKSFLPDFCGVRTVLAVVLSATLLAMVLSLVATSILRDFWEVFSILALYILWVGLAAAALICLLKRWLGRLGHGLAGLLAWCLIMLVALAVSLSANWLVPLDEMADVSPKELFFRTLGISGILGALILRYLYENYQQKQRELAESRARFQALQARIRPHFLFNSLNAVISLIPVDPVRAEETLQNLSDLFRASLGEESRMSNLAQELELARQYLAIEQQRLGERLQVKWDMQNMPDQAGMPALLLQPLVENAVYHGVEASQRGGEILVSGRCRKGIVALAVSNTLPTEGQDSPRKSNHMALENIRQRLQMRFGDAAGMHTGLVDNRYQVRIWFPVQESAG